MSEQAFWCYIRNGMQQKWESLRVENAVSSGTPDVAYSCNGVHGWIEFKYVVRWPSRYKTPLRLTHFTPYQKVFLYKHGEAGNHCFMFLKVDQDYLIFDHEHVFQIGELSKEELFEVALKSWHKHVDFDELGEILTR